MVPKQPKRQAPKSQPKAHPDDQMEPQDDEEQTEEQEAEEEQLEDQEQDDPEEGHESEDDEAEQPEDQEEQPGGDTRARTAGSQHKEVRMSQNSGACEILHLDLGPLDLDLLGLQIHLDRVVLDLTAQSGPGNLLGNLLCAITGLLNGFNLGEILMNFLKGLLDQLLGLLRPSPAPA